MRLILERSILTAVLFLMMLSATAHHSRAIYDQERTVTIEGVVTNYEWTNPHVYLYVESQDDSGDAVVWELEGNVTTIMRRLGWSKDTFAPGDRVALAHSMGLTFPELGIFCEKLIAEPVWLSPDGLEKAEITIRRDIV